MLGTAWRAIALTSIFALCACASNSAPQTVTDNGLPAIPDPQSWLPQVARQADFALQGSVAGYDYLETSPECITVPTHNNDLQLRGPAGYVTWAMYHFGPLYKTQALTSITVHILDNPPTDGLYLAVSDRDEGAWRIQPVPLVDGTGTVTVDPSVDYYYYYGPPSFSAGYGLVALICMDGIDRTIGGFDVVTEEAAPPPEHIVISHNSNNAGVELSWDDPAVSFDPDGNGPLTFDYDGIWIWRKVSDAGSSLLATLPPGTTSYFDDTAPPGVECIYKFKTLVDGVEPRATDYMAGERGTLPEAIIDYTWNGMTGVQQITLDAVADDADDHVISLYEWDVDNDGVYEYSSIDSKYIVNLDMSQAQTVGLRVTDNEGFQTTTTATFGP